MSKWFTLNEMRCKCGKCNGEVLVTQPLWDLMDAVRDAVGHPLVPNSGYRCAQHPDEQKPEGPGAHHFGEAVDFPCSTDRDRFLMVSTALGMGYTRAGIAKDFVHLDVSKTKAQRVIWVY